MVSQTAWPMHLEQSRDRQPGQMGLGGAAGAGWTLTWRLFDLVNVVMDRDHATRTRDQGTTPWRVGSCYLSSVNTPLTRNATQGDDTMNDTTHRPEAGRRLTGCPWPTGIHRFILGTCTRCGTDDLNPVSNRGGFTDQDDQPVPYVPTEAAALADAMEVVFPEGPSDNSANSADVLADAIRDALQAVRESGYLLGRTMSPTATAEDLGKSEHARQVADDATVALWRSFYAAVAR